MTLPVQEMSPRDAFAGILWEQVKLVGSWKIFSMIEKSFMDQHLITFFMKEQMALYAWRKKFFSTWFGDVGWSTDCNFLCMAEGVCGEAHIEATIHYNITENWEYLLVLSGQIINPHLPTDHFTHFPNTKYNLPSLLANEGEEALMRRLAMLDFSQAVHAICTLHICSPPTLKEIAIRKVVEEEPSTEELPKTVVAKVERGLYHRVILVDGKAVERETEDGMDEWEKPSHITEEGLALIEKFLKFSSTDESDQAQAYH